MRLTMRIGYARVSTLDQNPDIQLHKLQEAGCERVVAERASGARADRPELARLLQDILREGDVLVVWKLDRLARSLKQLIQTAEDLKNRGIGLVSLTDSSTPRPLAECSSFTCWVRSPNLNAH